MEENKVVNDTASFDGDVSPILPDGWENGKDLFAEGEDELAKLLADGQESEEPLEPENKGAESAPTAPTTGMESGDEGLDAEAAGSQTSPDGVRDGLPTVSRKLTLKVNHEEQEVDINAMSDDDLRALLQKGKAFDAMKDAENKRIYRKVYQEQIDAGMTEAAARMIAKDASDGHTYALTDEEETPAPAHAAPAGPVAPTPKTRDLRAVVEQLRTLYPDVKEMPDEVAKAVSRGIPVLTAYLAYRDRQSAQAAATLQKENRILKQNAANSAKAPVRGVTGGDSTPPKKKSLFEEGFDAGFNWH